jgi:hypothetical protein
VLSDSSFNKRHDDLAPYAQELGGLLATREENRAVARALLGKEENGTLNPAEKKLLTTYREKFVRDWKGALGVDGRRVRDGADLNDDDNPCDGALFVFPLAESKT